MTQLDEWMKAGIQVMISDYIQPDTVFAQDGLRVVNPVNYSYISNDDPFKAHEINMLRIYQNIEKAAEAACAKLDKMVDQMNHKFDRHIVMFNPHVEIVENEDGSYEMIATAGGDPVANKEFPLATAYLEAIE